MTKITVAIAASVLAFALPAAAAPSDSPVITLDHEGRSYEYTVTQRGSARVIEGVEQRSGARFALRVRGDMVRGQFGSSTVSFRVSEARGEVTRTILASR